MEYRSLHKFWPLVLAGLGAGTPALAGECTVDQPALQRGEARPFLICGAGIGPGSVLEGLEAAGITVEYQQVLGRCHVDVREPGLYAWLRAGADARSATISVVNRDTGQQGCSALPLSVPDRTLLPPARLEAAAKSADGSTYRLRIPLGDRSATALCGVRFLNDPRWPAVRAAGEGGPDCRRNELVTTVMLDGEQRFPVPVIVTGLESRDGTPGEGIAWFTPPMPHWESTLHPATARYADIAGYRTRYFDSDPKARPDRDTLLLVHGGQPDPVSPTAEYWRPNFAALAREFRVVAADSLGHGSTENPHSAADYARYYELIVEHLGALIDHLGLQRVHLVGHSQGGWAVLRLVLNRPDVAKCLVSTDTVMAPFTPDTSAVRYFAYGVTHIHPASGPNVYTLLRGDAFIAKTLNNISWEDAELQLALSRQPKFAEAKAAMGRIMMSPGNPYFRKLREQALAEVKAGRLTVPHLVYWGWDDQLAPLELGLNFFASMSAGPAPVAMHVISNAGHSPQVEHPAAFNAAVAGFCGQFRAGR